VGNRVNEVLIDTHALVWWLEGRERLSRKARETIESSETTVLVSAACAWELAIKSQIGKFKSPELVRGLENEIQDEGFIGLPISIDHALRAGGLSGPHRDPFDRMLIAQAQVEAIPVLSADNCFDDYGVKRIW
jgi:PIN domain nuclease of toxin-antitoxin system